MFDYYAQHVQISFWVRPTLVGRIFHKRLEKYADWQILAEFEWGVVGYDYEEGIRLAVLADPNSINSAVKWAEGTLEYLGADPKVMQEYKKEGLPWIEAHLSQRKAGSTEEEDLFGSLGWKRPKKSWRGWYWDFATCSIIECTKEPNQHVSVGGPKVDENTNTADAGVVNDPAPAAQVDVPVATNEQPTVDAPAAPKAERAKGVKGVTKTAREMKDAGKTRAEVQAAVTQLYMSGGKDEKAAKDAASVIVYNIFGPVKARTAPEPTSGSPAAETTPTTNA